MNIFDKEKYNVTFKIKGGNKYNTLFIDTPLDMIDYLPNELIDDLTDSFKSYGLFLYYWDLPLDETD